MIRPRLPHDIDYYKKKRHEEATRESLFFRVLKGIRKKKGLIIGFTIAAIILLLPLPGPSKYGEHVIHLTREGKAAIALLTLFVTIFVTEAMPFGMTMALVYSWIVLFRVVPIEQSARLFSHDAAWFLVGALMIASVLVRHGIHKRVLSLILKLVGYKVKWVIFGIVLFCGVSSMFIADHSIAAMMLPVGLAIVDECGGYKKVPRLAKCLMFAIAFGCSIGGPGTPSGGGRNVVMIAYLQEFFDVSVSYGAWMTMAFPFTLIMVPIVTFILWRLFKPEITEIKHVQERLNQQIKAQAMSSKEWATIAIFIIVLGLWICKSDLGIGMIAMFGSLLYLLFGVAEWEDYQRINWSIVMLYFAAIGLGRALIMSEAATWLAANILLGINKIGIHAGLPLTAASSVFMTGMTQTMGDGPCVASMGPMLLESAKLAGNDPVVFGVALAISSAFAFAIIIGTPPNAIVYGSGYVKAKDFLRAGALLCVIAITLLILIIATWWKVLGVGAAGFH